MSGDNFFHFIFTKYNFQSAFKNIGIGRELKQANYSPAKLLEEIQQFQTCFAIDNSKTSKIRYQCNKKKTEKLEL